MISPHFRWNGEQMFAILTRVPSPSRLQLAERGLLEVTGPPGSGVTSMLLALLGPLSGEGPVAYLDVRGEVSPVAAAEAGCCLEHLVFVHAPHPDSWAKALSYLIDGVRAIAAEAPRGVPASALRALAGRVRARRRFLALTPLRWSLPADLANGRIVLLGSSWDVLQGRGALSGRQIRVRLEGKLVHGSALTAVVTPPLLELAPELVPAPERRVVGR
jgi:hypothetical protein